MEIYNYNEQQKLKLEDVGLIHLAQNSNHLPLS